MSGFNRLIKNSVSNIINGFSNVILGIVISPLLIKVLSISDFSIWSLVLQTGAFFSLLGFTGQLSVARYITLAKTQQNEHQSQCVMRYGLCLSLIAVLLSIVLLYVGYANFYAIFNAIKEYDSPYAPNVFFIVSLSFILGLIASSYNGYFTGIERNEIPAFVNLISRVILGVCIYVAAHYSMLAMAWAYFAVNIISYIVIYVLYRNIDDYKIKVKNKIKYKYNDADVSFKMFMSYCFGVLIFNVSTFLIVNTNSVLIGRFAFDDYVYYALSMTLVTAIIGFLNAALTPVLQPIVKLVHQDDKVKIDIFIFCLIKLILLLSFFILITNLLVGKYVLNFWIGKDIAAMTYPIFMLLLLTNLSRLIGAPLGLVYLAKGKQNEIMYLPLLEGIISVVITYIFAKSYGMYASVISLAISTIVIMLIYSFKLIGIAAIEQSRAHYKCLLAGGPILLMAVIFSMMKIDLKINAIISSIIFDVVMVMFLIGSAALIYLDAKKIKYILES